MTDITKVREWIDAEGREPDAKGEYDWPAPPSYIESEVTGDLRATILAKLGRADAGQLVRLIESEVEGGWSEWTYEIDCDVEVWIGDEKVWSYSDWDAGRSMTAFLKWAATTERNPAGRLS